MVAAAAAAAVVVVVAAAAVAAAATASAAAEDSRERGRLSKVSCWPVDTSPSRWYCALPSSFPLSRSSLVNTAGAAVRSVGAASLFECARMLCRATRSPVIPSGPSMCMANWRSRSGTLQYQVQIQTSIYTIELYFPQSSLLGFARRLIGVDTQTGRTRSRGLGKCHRRCLQRCAQTTSLRGTTHAKYPSE